jgi:hypothetical protein
MAEWYGLVQAVVFAVAGMLMILFNRQWAAFTIRAQMRQCRRPHWIGKEPTPEVVQSAWSVVAIATRVMSVIVGTAFLVSGVLTLVEYLS